MSDLILYEFHNHVATLTFNNPENLNAMDEAMGHSFGKILDQIENNPHVRCVILTGSGRAFSSGGNLEMLLQKINKSKSQNKKELKAFYQMFLRIRKLKVPVIAAINGHAVGAGFCVSLACDLRFASVNAKMGANFARIALAPGMGGTYLITRLAGTTKAAEILFLADLFDANQAFEYGLLNRVLEPEDLLTHCQSVAQKIAANGPLSIQMIKKGILKAENSILEEMFEYDSQSQADCFATDDIKEGVKAAQEKRAALFTGK